ncbi:hypothetical protein GLW07_13185 [Bacillus hwajinpoensis]|uniref:Uncharacterized protein n=1 Tax=Guptibacillus hwajinpoensis TaxID=208199 RepID=A0A845F0R5_9BACL|nr:hypothetical protein [Pseudalkalibacillus hwajinpoensis]MYL64305.1 hypothetical protein [Pseudalkalibacillus hwajinpoensis]
MEIVSLSIIWFIVLTSMGIPFLYWGVREVWRGGKGINRAKGYLECLYEVVTFQLSSVSLHLLVGVVLIIAGGMSLFF